MRLDKIPVRWGGGAIDFFGDVYCRFDLQTVLERNGSLVMFALCLVDPLKKPLIDVWTRLNIGAIFDFFVDHPS
jgi:hypothetical protein